jgi:acetylornithine aminotransferase/acetylornithine/N-succinyldiaminopimelate aminotransferase
MTLASIKKSESALLLPTYDRLPLVASHGKGVYLYATDGRRYLDFLSGIGVNALGYSHPAINKVIAKQAKQLIHTSNLIFHKHTEELAKKLTKVSGLDRVFFTNDGRTSNHRTGKVSQTFSAVDAGGGICPLQRCSRTKNKTR